MGNRQCRCTKKYTLWTKGTGSDSNAPRRDQIIEVQTHNVKPDSVDKYVSAHKALVEYINANKETLHCEALGNFVVFVGDEDQFVHVWRFDEGYRGIDKTLNAFVADQGRRQFNSIVNLFRPFFGPLLSPFFEIADWNPS